MPNRRLRAPAVTGRAGPSRDAPTIDAEAALEALDDADCRAMLEAASGGARTAGELIERCELPRSTVYRKLDCLVDAGLLAEGVRIRPDGAHASEYRRTTEAVVVSIADDGDVQVDRPDGPTAEP